MDSPTELIVNAWIVVSELRPQSKFIEAACGPRLFEPGSGRDDPAGPATGRAQRDASDSTRSAAGLGRAAETARKLSRTTPEICRTTRFRRGLACRLNRSELSRSGTASMAVREKEPNRSGRSLVADSALEEDGFELSVLPRRESLCGATPGKHRRLGPEPVGGSAFSCRRLRLATPRREPSQERDRWFESGSLQRRVRKLSVPLGDDASLRCSGAMPCSDKLRPYSVANRGPAPGLK